MFYFRIWLAVKFSGSGDTISNSACALCVSGCEVEGISPNSMFSLLFVLFFG